jgi:hypothetical protein
MTIVGVLVAATWIVLVGIGGSTPRSSLLLARGARKALAAWERFPIAAVPRPVIALGGGIEMPPRNQHDAIVFDTGRYRFDAPIPDGPTSVGGYTLISAKRAAQLVQTLSQQKGSSRGPLIAIDAIRLGHASWVTDRGSQSLPTWLFYAKGLRRPAAVLAVHPYTAPNATRPKLPLHTVADTEEEFATVTGHGRRISIYFVGGPAGNQPCDDSYTARYFTSRTAIAYAITEVPVPGNAICTLVGYERHVVVDLQRALGSRVLIDAADAIAIPAGPKPLW